MNIRYSLVVGAAAAALTFSWGNSARAVVVTYNSQSAWDAAVSSYVTEPFNSGGLQSFTHVVSTVGQIGPARGVLTGSVWQDRPTRSGGESTTFSYIPGNISGAGGIWDTSPAGEGQGLIITLNLAGGGTDVAGQIGPIDGGFFGFTSTDPIASFTITAGNNSGSAETYDLQNLSFAPAAPAVPEPSALALLGSGLLALAGLRLRGRKHL